MQSGATVVAVAEMIKKRGWTKYVTLGQDYEWGRDAQRVFVGEMAKASPQTKLIKELWCKLGETDFSSYITAVMGFKPDFMFGAIAGKDNETFLQQAKAMGLFKKVAYPGVFLPVTELIQQAKTLPRGIIGLARCPFFANMRFPMMQNYMKLYQGKFGKNDFPDDFACMYFDALNGLTRRPPRPARWTTRPCARRSPGPPSRPVGASSLSATATTSSIAPPMWERWWTPRSGPSRSLTPRA